MEKQLYQLKVDPELESFMSPLSEAEQASLEENIVANGCRVPLVIWNGTIVDGHHRYEICHKHGIPFAVEEQSFADKGEAMLWMFQEQRSHRNLSPVARVVMALKCKPILLEMGKKNQGHRSDLDLLFKSTKSHDTRQMIAEIADVSPTMAYKVEKISEVADAETMGALIREEIKVGPTYAKLCKPKKEEALLTLLQDSLINRNIIDAAFNRMADTMKTQGALMRKEDNIEKRAKGNAMTAFGKAFRFPLVDLSVEEVDVLSDLCVCLEELSIVTQRTLDSNELEHSRLNEIVLSTLADAFSAQLSQTINNYSRKELLRMEREM